MRNIIVHTIPYAPRVAFTVLNLGLFCYNQKSFLNYNIKASTACCLLLQAAPIIGLDSAVLNVLRKALLIIELQILLPKVKAICVRHKNILLFEKSKAQHVHYEWNENDESNLQWLEYSVDFVEKRQGYLKQLENILYTIPELLLLSNAINSFTNITFSLASLLFNLNNKNHLNLHYSLISCFFSFYCSLASEFFTGKDGWNFASLCNTNILMQSSVSVCASTALYCIAEWFNFGSTIFQYLIVLLCNYQLLSYISQCFADKHAEQGYSKPEEQKQCVH